MLKRCLTTLGNPPNMGIFLSSLPLWVMGLLMIGGSAAVAMICPLLIRRRISLEEIVANNEVAGFKFAVVGVVYAVLLAFAVVVVWDKYAEAERAVVDEAGAAATLYRLFEALPPDREAMLQTTLSTYLETAIIDEWPAMEHGQSSLAVSKALDAIYQGIIADSTIAQKGALAVQEMYRQVDDITHARRVRLHLSRGVVPGVIWFALVASAVLTIVFTFFFGTRNLRAQVLMTGILAAMTFIGLFVIISIDYPFTGPVRIEPQPLQNVMANFRDRQPQTPR
jgi:hypothetical protein